MAEDAISWESSTPSIRVNDVDIVEVCHRPQKKRVENQAVRRKRLAAQHDLRTCGCTCRDGLAAQHICQVLYELAKKEQQQNCNELTELWKTPRYFRSSEPVSNAIKRPHQVAFPSSFFGREACLNFFHKRATMELELNKGTSIAPGHDVKRERNNIRFRKSEASTSFIPYNFQNSYRQKKEDVRRRQTRIRSLHASTKGRRQQFATSKFRGCFCTQAQVRTTRARPNHSTHTVVFLTSPYMRATGSIQQGHWRIEASMAARGMSTVLHHVWRTTRIRDTQRQAIGPVADAVDMVLWP